MKRLWAFVERRLVRGDRLDRAFILSMVLAYAGIAVTVFSKDARPLVAAVCLMSLVGIVWNVRELRRTRTVTRHLVAVGADTLSALPPAEQEEYKMSLARLKLSARP